MERLDHDEIASILLARLLKEVENFSATGSIDDEAKSGEIWSRFLQQLRDGKPPTADGTQRPKTAASTHQLNVSGKSDLSRTPFPRAGFK